MKGFILDKGFISEKENGKEVIFDNDTSTFFSFNETGSFIFKHLKKGTQLSKISALMAESFSVTQETAEKDVRLFVSALLRKKIIRES